MLGVSSDTLLQVVLGSGVVFGLLSLAGILIRVLELNFYGVPLSALDLRSSAETYSKGFLAIFTLCFILLIFVVSILLHLYPLLAPSGQGMTATPSEQSAMVKPPKQTNVWAEVALTYKPLTCFVLLAFLVIQASYPDPGVFLSRGSQLPHVKRSWYILPLHWMRYIFSRWNTALMCQSIIAYILTLLFLAIQTYVAAIFFILYLGSISSLAKAFNLVLTVLSTLFVFSELVFTLASFGMLAQPEVSLILKRSGITTYYMLASDEHFVYVTEFPKGSLECKAIPNDEILSMTLIPPSRSRVSSFCQNLYQHLQYLRP